LQSWITEVDWYGEVPAPATGRSAPNEEEPMAQSAGLHEPGDLLSPQTVDRHRAVTSLQEELEAVDWYDQRVDATSDGELAAVLAHNRDEEKEHAAMTLEWLRRHDPVLDAHLRTYLFTSEPVTEIETVAAETESAGGAVDLGGSLGIGSLKGETR
jgi:ferritin-like protein